MNTFAFITFFALLAATNAGYYGPSAKILQGPSSKTTLVGPEGSVISAIAPGGQIIHEEHPGYIAHAAPVATYAAHAPVVAHAAPLVAASPVAYASPIAVGHETHISKYGTHISHGSPAVYSAPAVVAHAAPVAAYAAPLAYAAHAPVVAHGIGHHGYAGALVAGHSLAAPYQAHGLYGGNHYDGHHGLYL